MDFSPPIKLNTEQKVEYNKAAYVLNKEMEKRALEEYTNDIAGLASDSLFTTEKSNQGLKISLLGYRNMIDLDYPKLTDKDIAYYIKTLDFHAKLLGVQAELNLQKPSKYHQR